MLAQKDIATLHEAGLNIDRLAAAAAAFIRAHPAHVAYPMTNTLSEQEEKFLRRGGALGVGESDPASLSDNVAAMASEYAGMVATGYSQRQTAKVLGVTTSRVRQRIDKRSLYAVDGPEGRICPTFQFAENGTLPGLEKVLAAISKDAHPVAVQRFFLNQSPDLESQTLGEILSPRTWLTTGHPVKPVMVLAHEI